MYRPLVMTIATVDPCTYFSLGLFAKVFTVHLAFGEQKIYWPEISPKCPDNAKHFTGAQ